MESDDEVEDEGFFDELLVLQLQIEDWQRRSALSIVAAECMELVSSSPARPVEQVFNAVPSSPQQVSEQVAQFGNAERHLAAGSFFLPVSAERPVPRGPAWPV